MFVGAISVQWCRVKKVISGTIVNCRPPALLLTNNLSSALSHFFWGKYSEEFHVKLTFKRWNENIVRIQLLFGSFLGAATFWGKLTLGTLGNVSANMQSLYSLEQSSQCSREEKPIGIRISQKTETITIRAITNPNPGAHDQQHCLYLFFVVVCQCICGAKLARAFILAFRPFLLAGKLMKMNMWRPLSILGSSLQKSIEIMIIPALSYYYPSWTNSRGLIKLREGQEKRESC